tara:strand:+ start:669 stop:1595 length:927 start_codon:yes stop_codon:yes gene_type:complete
MNEIKNSLEVLGIKKKKDLLIFEELWELKVKQTKNKFSAKLINKQELNNKLIKLNNAKNLLKERGIDYINESIFEEESQLVDIENDHKITKNLKWLQEYDVSSEGFTDLLVKENFVDLKWTLIYSRESKRFLKDNYATNFLDDDGENADYLWTDIRLRSIINNYDGIFDDDEISQIALSPIGIFFAYINGKSIFFKWDKLQFICMEDDLKTIKTDQFYIIFQWTVFAKEQTRMKCCLLYALISLFAACACYISKRELPFNIIEPIPVYLLRYFDHKIKSLYDDNGFPKAIKTSTFYSLLEYLNNNHFY